MNKMKQMILSNIFPVSGGTAGALWSTTLGEGSSWLSQLPNKEAIVATIILALIGAITGYVAGKVCGWIHKGVSKWKKHNRDKVEHR